MRQVALSTPLTSTSGVSVPNREMEHKEPVNNGVVTYTLSQSELAKKQEKWDKQKRWHYRALEVRA